VDSVARQVLRDPLDASNETINGPSGAVYLCYHPDTQILTLRGEETPSDIAASWTELDTRRFRITPISSMKPGDHVLSHEGRWKRVEVVMHRPYSGKLIRLKRRGCGEAALTPDHKIMVLRTPQRSTRHPSRSIDKTLGGNLDWMEARDVQIGDYVAIPVPRVQGKGLVKAGLSYSPKRKHAKGPMPKALKLPFNTNTMRLLGYYLAEGSTKQGAACIAHHAKEMELVEEIDLISQSLGLNTSHHSEGNSGVVQINSAPLASILKKSFGSPAPSKSIPYWLLNLPTHKIKEFLLAYWKGDGFEATAKQGYYYGGFTTSSKDLAWAIHVALAAQKIPSGVHCQDNSAGFKRQDGSEQLLYTVHLGGQAYDDFRSLVGAKVLPRKRKAMSNGMFRRGDYLFYKIIDKSEEDYTGEVWNLQIEGDKSFTTTLSASRNCTVNKGLRFPTSDIPENGSNVSTIFNPAKGEQVRTVSDPDSIAMMAAREGSTGIYEYVMSIPEYRVEDANPIIFMGQLILARHAWPILSGSFETMTIQGWRAGQYFTVNSPKRDIYDYKVYQKQGIKQDPTVYVQTVTKEVNMVRGDDGLTSYLIRNTIAFSTVISEQAV
jgi:hypothetical protein